MGRSLDTGARDGALHRRCPRHVVAPAPIVGVDALATEIIK
jgi:hypothetical protein